MGVEMMNFLMCIMSFEDEKLHVNAVIIVHKFMRHHRCTIPKNTLKLKFIVNNL